MALGRIDKSRQRPRRGARIAAIARAATIAAGLLSATGAAVAEVNATATAVSGNGFARIVVKLDRPVGHDKTLENGVLVVSLDQAVDVDLSTLAESIPDYLIAARLDPSGEALRFALARPVSVNTIAAGQRIFIDLLPGSWTGPPPGLPESVVAELIRQAEQAASDAARGRLEAEPGRPPLEIRVGRYPTFSRIVFDWDDPARTELSRQGDTVTVTFNREADPNLSRINADPPRHLVSAAARSAADGLAVDLTVEPGTDVRGFREGVTYIVDLADGSPGAEEDSGAPLREATSGPAMPDNATGAEEVFISGTDTAAQPPRPREDALVSVSVEPLAIARGETETPKRSSDPLAEVPATAVPSEAGKGRAGAAATASEPPPPMADTSAAPAESADEAVAPAPETGGIGPPSEPAPAVASSEDGDDAAPDEAGDAADGLAGAVEVTAKIVGATLQIDFPFQGQVAAAAFQRGSTLWVVFDTDAVLDVSRLETVAGPMVEAIQVVRSGTVQIVRLSLSGPYLTTATTRTHHWIVSVGDLLLDPTTPLTLERALRSDGRSKVVVELADAGRVHWLSDREFADQLAVVTAFGPPRGLIKRQEFIEFTALPTAHGLAIRPRADDLAVRLVQDEVIVTRNDGLTISAGRWPLYLPSQAGAGDGSRPGFIDFEGWAEGGPAALRGNVRRLLRTIAELEPEERVNARLELARLYLAHELAAEAMGVIRLAAEEDPEAVNDPVFRAMRGVARVMMGQTDEARADLSVHGLAHDPHSSLWRGLIELADGHFREARLAFESGAEAIDAYPSRHQARFRLAAARAALEINDVEAAARDLDALSGADLDRKAADRAMFLNAWLAELLGETAAAVEGYQAAAAGATRQVETEARFRLVDLNRREGRITAEEAIEALEGLAVSWRGDGIELAVQRRLAALYRDSGRYRDALNTMKDAIISHPDNERVRFVGDEMNALFDQLFLEGGADSMPPVTALGLYYDFRELTPVGRRGDEMIRRLAERLVEVDLLDQAAELLNHQVMNRLSGVARAQVAADLAVVYLTAHQPENALRALRQSRQAILPVDLDRKRTLLEARALAELGRVELAVELLDTISGDEVERAKADALWLGERWQGAGEQIERLLAARWRNAEPLSDAERFDVMRVAIAYTFAEDRLGLDRLRHKFAEKMAESPDANAFDLVTHEVDVGDGAFRDLAAEIAQTDTLDAFLAEYKARYGAEAAGGSG